MEQIQKRIELGQQIRDNRQRLPLTMDAAAQKYQISRQTLSAMESGRFGITAQTARVLLALGPDPRKTLEALAQP